MFSMNCMAGVAGRQVQEGTGKARSRKPSSKLGRKQRKGSRKQSSRSDRKQRAGGEKQQ